jgi:hypothetical protein
MLAKPDRVVEARRLLQLALDLVDDLVLHLLDRRAGPEHLHDHHAKRKVRILLLTDAQEGKGTSREQQHQEKRSEPPVIVAHLDRLKPFSGATRVTLADTENISPCA